MLTPNKIEVPQTSTVSSKLVSFLHKFDFQPKTEASYETSLETLMKNNVENNSDIKKLSLPKENSIIDLNEKQNISLKNNSSISSNNHNNAEKSFKDKSQNVLIPKTLSNNQTDTVTESYDDAFFDDELSFDVFINSDFNDSDFSDDDDDKLKECVQNDEENSSAAVITTSKLDEKHENLNVSTVFSDPAQINPFSSFFGSQSYEQHSPKKQLDSSKACKYVALINQPSTIVNKDIECTFEENYISSPHLEDSHDVLLKRINKNLVETSFKDSLSVTPLGKSKSFISECEEINQEIQEYKGNTSKELQKWENSTSNEIQICSTPLQINKFSTSLSSCKSRKRKFPGPAGLLPDLPPNSPLVIKEYEKNLRLSNPQRPNDEVFCTQATANDFLPEPWYNMIKDLDNSSLLKKFNIKYVKMKIARKKLPKFVEIPFFCALIKSIFLNDDGVRIVVKDETGDMPGTIEQEVYEKFGRSLHVGSVLVLKNARFLLNQLIVKLIAIIRIYSFDGSVIDVNNWDCIKSISNNYSIRSDNKLSLSTCFPNKLSTSTCSTINANTSDNISNEQSNYDVDLLEESVFEDGFDDIICSLDESSFIT